MGPSLRPREALDRQVTGWMGVFLVFPLAPVPFHQEHVRSTISTRKGKPPMHPPHHRLSLHYDPNFWTRVTPLLDRGDDLALLDHSAAFFEAGSLLTD